MAVVHIGIAGVGIGTQGLDAEARRRSAGLNRTDLALFRRPPRAAIHRGIHAVPPAAALPHNACAPVHALPDCGHAKALDTSSGPAARPSHLLTKDLSS